MSNNKVEKIDIDTNIECVDVDYDTWCRTKVGEEVKFRFVWTIERFSERPEKNTEGLDSSMFSVHGPGKMETHWRVRVYPKGCQGNDGDGDFSSFLSVFLYNETEIEVKARYQFSILDINKETKHCTRHFTKIFAPEENWGFNKLIELSSLKSESSPLLPNDSLTIVCDITIIGHENTVTVSKHRVEEHKTSDKLELLSHDLEKLISSQELSDVQILCGDKLFHCHQVILSARSPVFRVMFQADMAEKKTKKVEVTDFHPDIVSELLTFIYTGQTPKLTKRQTSKDDTYALRLLQAAEKYQLDQLKSICVEMLCNNVDAKNCLHYLVTGYLYEGVDLKKSSLHFISSNAGSVFKSKDWKDALKDHPDLMAEVIDVIVRPDGKGDEAEDNQGTANS